MNEAVSGMGLDVIYGYVSTCISALALTLVVVFYFVFQKKIKIGRMEHTNRFAKLIDRIEIGQKEADGKAATIETKIGDLSLQTEALINGVSQAINISSERICDRIVDETAKTNEEISKLMDELHRIEKKIIDEIKEPLDLN
jgi:gas vesicle protein